MPDDRAPVDQDEAGAVRAHGVEQMPVDAAAGAHHELAWMSRELAGRGIGQRLVIADEPKPNRWHPADSRTPVAAGLRTT
jgi:hypothetical protein